MADSTTVITPIDPTLPVDADPKVGDPIVTPITTPTDEPAIQTQSPLQEIDILPQIESIEKIPVTKKRTRKKKSTETDMPKELEVIQAIEPMIDAESEIDSPQLPKMDLSGNENGTSDIIPQIQAPENSESEVVSLQAANTQDQILIRSDEDPIPQMQEAQDQAPSSDPFEGLNIVFDKPTETNTTQTPLLQGVSETKSEYIDPFLNPQKKDETLIMNPSHDGEASEVVQIEDSSLSSSEVVPVENTQIPNIDAMLNDASTSTSWDIQENPPSKKKKILVFASWAVGVLLLVSASYMVFTTMYPTETNNLMNNIQNNSSGTIQNGDTSANENSDSWTIAQWTDEQLPATDTTRDGDQLPNTYTSSFGNEDQLPNPPAEETLNNSDPSSWTITWEIGDANVNEAFTVDPEVSKALQTIEDQTSKSKQLLALAKEKKDSDSIRSIAGVIKSLKAIKEKVDNKSFTSYSTQIEGELSKTSFTLDQIAAKLIGG